MSWSRVSRAQAVTTVWPFAATLSATGVVLLSRDGGKLKKMMTTKQNQNHPSNAYNKGSNNNKNSNTNSKGNN